MIEAHYINLDRAQERRALMERQGERIGLRLTRSPAFEAADVSDADFARLSVQWERPITRIEVAVLLSHARLWQRSVDTGAAVAIFEDDALLSGDLPAFLASDFADYDLVNLEYFGRRKFFRSGRPHPANSAAARRIAPVAREKAGACGYVISPNGALKALGALGEAAAPADAFLYAGGRLSIGQAEPALAVQVEVMTAKGFDVGITTTTQIHAPRDRLPVSWSSARYAWRRTLGQMKLVPYNLGRGTLYDLREPEVDLEEFASAQRDS